MNKLIDKYKKIPVQARASLWFLICSFLQRGISVITTPVFTRILSTTEYGQFNAFTSWLGIVTVIVSLDLYAGVYTQGLIKYDKDKAHFSSSLQGLTLILISVWTLLYTCTRSFWNNLLNLSTVQIYAMMVMIWSSAAFRFWSAEKRVTYSYRCLVIVTILVSLAKPAIGIIFVMHSADKVTARILGLALVELIGYTWMFFIQMMRGKQFVNKKYWLYALSFNLPLIPHYLSQIILSSSDRLMIKSMVGDSEAGIYSLAYSLSQIMLLFNQALLKTIEPWVYQKIKSDRTKDIPKVAYPSFVFIAIVNLALMAIAPEAVRFFAPSAYYDAIWVIPPVAMSVFFSFTYSFFATFEFYFEKTKFIMTASIIGASLNLFLNWIFIRIFGYYAAGYTTLFCYVVFAVGHYYFMNRICKKEMGGIKVYNTWFLLSMSVVFMVLGFALMATYTFPVVRYAIIVIALIAIIIKRKTILKMVGSFVHLRRKENA